MRRSLLAVAAVSSTLSVAASAQVCTPFNDVASADPFCTNIQWMFNRAITLGCAPTAYCPTQFVRRDQMAAFMNRLGNITFQQGGNAFGGTAVLGTNDDQPVEIRVDGRRAARFEPNDLAPNVVVGSDTNAVSADVRGATIAGGGITGEDPVFGGGAPNRVTDAFGAIGGGFANRAGNDDLSALNAAFGTIAGGQANSTGGFGATVGGGSANSAGGDYATVPGGLENAVPGAYGFAAGYRARANHAGCFVYSDASVSNPTSCFAPHEIVIRGRGGFYFFTGGLSDPTYTGAQLSPGTGAWAAYSDRNGKREFAPVDVAAVLDKVIALPISTWQWNAEPGAVRHMGPMAQDFHAAFNLGDRDTQIVTVDVDGVALAAIQGLNAKVDDRVVVLQRRIDVQQREIDELRQRLERLLAR